MTGRARVAAALFALSAASACAGPQAPLNVGMNSRPVDLLLGERIRVVTESVAPPISPSFAPNGTASDRPSYAPRGPVHLAPGSTPPLPERACPAASADAPILTQKTASPPGPPSSATYTYRVKGSVTAAGHTKALPAKLTRDVANIRPDPPAAYTFDAFDSLDSESSVTSYRLVPDWYPARPPTGTVDVVTGTAQTDTGQQVPGNPAGSRAQPGLYITRLAASDTGLRVPDPGIKVVEFPVATGASFSTAASDGVTTMTYTSTVNRVPARVDACGVLLDVFQVDLTGEITKQTDSPGDQGYVRATFNASYGVAPQFGALVVWEKVAITSADVSRTEEATINQEPARPQPGSG